MRARRWRGAAAVLATVTVLVLSQPGAQAATPVTLEVALHAYVGQFSSAPATKVVLLVSTGFAVGYACDNKTAAALVGQGGGRPGSYGQHGRRYGHGPL